MPHFHATESSPGQDTLGLHLRDKVMSGSHVDQRSCGPAVEDHIDVQESFVEGFGVACQPLNRIDEPKSAHLRWFGAALTLLSFSKDGL